MTTSEKKSSGNVILDNPGVFASLFAVLVVAAFLGLLYNNVTSHHDSGGGEHGEHKAAPAGEAHH